MPSNEWTRLCDEFMDRAAAVLKTGKRPRIRAEDVLTNLSSTDEADWVVVSATIEDLAISLTPNQAGIVFCAFSAFFGRKISSLNPTWRIDEGESGDSMNALMLELILGSIFGVEISERMQEGTPYPYTSLLHYLTVVEAALTGGGER